jgi:hypothetical protein
MSRIRTVGAVAIASIAIGATATATSFARKIEPCYEPGTALQTDKPKTQFKEGPGKAFTTRFVVWRGQRMTAVGGCPTDRYYEITIEGKDGWVLQGHVTTQAP